MNDPLGDPVVEVLDDLSPMPFGKHKGQPMQDVPASYLHWLWTEGCNNPQVSDYIKRNLSALKKESPDRIWN
jgi:uncharacterized protein (DUF3820 family)